MSLRDSLRLLGSQRGVGRNLNAEEAYRAFTSILAGSEPDIRIATFLTTLRWKGVTVEELVGFARALRDRARIPCMGMPGLVTLCPPQEGYDSMPPLDVAAGLMAAGAGARVLMVVDRNVPPKRGVSAANVLERLECGLTWDPSEAEDWVVKARFSAIGAPGMLPALLGLRDVRRDIGLRTPLATAVKLMAPAGTAVVLGAQAGPVLGTAVEVMQTLGHPAGMAIQGIEGGLVPTLRKRSRGIQLDGQHQVPLTIEPGDFGMLSDADAELPMFGPPEEGQGTADNPSIVDAAVQANLSVLAGQPGELRNHALLATACILKTVGLTPTLADGVAKATDALDSGAASAVLENLRSLADRSGPKR